MISFSSYSHKFHICVAKTHFYGLLHIFVEFVISVKIQRRDTNRTISKLIFAEKGTKKTSKSGRNSEKWGFSAYIRARKKWGSLRRSQLFTVSMLHKQNTFWWISISSLCFRYLKSRTNSCAIQSRSYFLAYIVNTLTTPQTMTSQPILRDFFMFENCYVSERHYFK